MIFKDLVGRSYGRLTVVSLHSRDRKSRWHCRCDCGSSSVVTAIDLGSGNTMSCGCLKLDRAREVNTKHGLRDSREYRSWAHAKERCYNRNVKNYQGYGGRGITMCDLWRDDFAAFYRHIGPKPSASHLLDRIDNDGNYEPGNVKWSTPKESANNRRRQRHYLGRPMPWFREANL